MTTTAWLMIALALSGPVTYAVMKTKYEIQMAAAVASAKDEGVRVCNGRIAELGLKSREEAARRAEEGRKAADAVSPTPADKAALQAICARSASCIERREFQ